MDVSPDPRKPAALILGVLVIVATFVTVGTQSAQATHPLWYNDARIHWQNFDVRYHFTSNLLNNYVAYQTPSNNARARWINATSPNSPWHTHYDSGAPNHVDVALAPIPSWLGFASLVYTANSSWHLSSTLVAWDSRDADAGLIYTGSNVNIPNTQYDAWSIIQEEWGHAQNMNHFGTACRTMSGTTSLNETCKRGLIQAERTAACEPYEHPQVLAKHHNAGNC